MINTMIDNVKSHKNFYGKVYRKELIFLMALILTQVILIIMIMYIIIIRHNEIPAFYSSSSDGILTPLKPLGAPNQSAKPLLE